MATMMDDVVALSIAEMRKLTEARGKDEIEAEVARARAIAAAGNTAIGATTAQLGVMRAYMAAGATAADVCVRFRGLIGPAFDGGERSDA